MKKLDQKVKDLYPEINKEITCNEVSQVIKEINGGIIIFLLHSFASTSKQNLIHLHNLNASSGHFSFFRTLFRRTIVASIVNVSFNALQFTGH